MTGTGFLILFGLICVLFPCEGQVKPPSNGTKLTFFPGSTVKIDWSYVGSISQVQLRQWFFKSSDGPQKGQLAAIAFDLPSVQKNLTILPRFDIERPVALVLKNVNKTYNGIYTLNLLTQSSSVPQTSEVVVYIAAKPNVTFSCPIHNEINEGDHFTCTCRGEDGNPPADVTWFKDGVPIVGTEKENIILTLNNVNDKGSGTYKCEARSHSNTMFIDAKEITVDVNFKPKDTSIEFTQNPVELGKPVTIKCQSRGFPVPSYTITLNGTKTVSPEKTYTISMAGWNDTGLYNCTAMNKHGSDWNSTFLNVTKQGPTTQPPPSSTPTSTTEKSSNGTGTTDDGEGKGGLSTGAVIGIIIGVLVLLVIIGIVVYCCKSKEKDGRNRANIDPVPGNHYELENEEPGPGDGAYDSVGPVGASSSKSKPPAGNTLPPVYAAVDKNNRQGNTLYASLDTDAMQSSRASKKEPDRPPQTEYASIDFKKSAPKADLV